MCCFLKLIKNHSDVPQKIELDPFPIKDFCVMNMCCNGLKRLVNKPWTDVSGPSMAFIAHSKRHDTRFTTIHAVSKGYLSTMLLVQGTLLVAAFGCNLPIVVQLNEFKKLTPLVESLVKIPVCVCLATASKFMRFCLVESGLGAKDT